MNDAFTQAVASLIDYGYTAEEDGSLVRYKGGKPRTKWVPVGDTGFLRYEREDGWVQYPYQVADTFQGVGGLSPETHRECFDWVYPAEYVLNVYATALAEQA
jgi:hypothetical protein